MVGRATNSHPHHFALEQRQQQHTRAFGNRVKQNNKAETVLQIMKDEFDRDISSVTAIYIRGIEFEPFAFHINSESMPELVTDYQPKPNTAQKGFDYQEVPETKH